VVTPFSLPLEKDPYAYLVKSLEITNGDFAPIQTHALGWPLLMSFFFLLFKSQSIFQNMFYTRIISDVFGALSIFPLAYIGKQLFDKRILFVLLILFCFSSSLIISATSAYTESLFIFLFLITLCFIFKTLEKQKYILFAACSGAIAYYVRPNGFLVLLIILISFLLMRKQIPNFKYTYFIYLILIFGAISAPFLYQRYLYFGSPFSYGENSKYFIDSPLKVWSYNIPIPTFWEYIKTHTVVDYFNKFIIFGFFKIIFRFVYNLISPLLLLFFFYGIIRYSGNRKFIPITIGLVIWSIAYIPVIHTHGSPRQLFPTIPFILIFSTIGLYDILSTPKYKNTLIALFIGFYVLFSLIIPVREKVNAAKDPIHDGLIWSKWIAEHVQGKIAVMEGRDLIMLQLPNTRVGGLKNLMRDAPISKISALPPGYFTDLDSAMKWFNLVGITHLVIDDKILEKRSYLKQIYATPEPPPYLTEIYSNVNSSSKWKIRVYSIDWSKFNP
jgi:hypothetical protein